VQEGDGRGADLSAAGDGGEGGETPAPPRERPELFDLLGRMRFCGNAILKPEIRGRARSTWVAELVRCACKVWTRLYILFSVPKQRRAFGLVV
jgi:hypothetical protein